MTRQSMAEPKAEKKAKQPKAPKAPTEAKPKEPRPPAGPAPTPRLLEMYRSTVIGSLKERFQYRNVMQVPRLTKVVLNVGLGEALQNAKLLEAAAEELGAITGQKAVITKSRKAIANFKLRENQSIGCRVTLRNQRMYEFLDRLINVALPRVRDFRGVSPNAFDGRGSFSMGLREQIIFPEIDFDKVEKIRGMNITIVTTAKTDEEGRALLGGLGMPFRS
jgi:large subunit ribosomal protein L5